MRALISSASLLAWLQTQYRVTAVLTSGVVLVGGCLGGGQGGSHVWDVMARVEHRRRRQSGCKSHGLFHDTIIANERKKSRPQHWTYSS